MLTSALFRRCSQTDRQVFEAVLINREGDNLRQCPVFGTFIQRNRLFLERRAVLKPCAIGDWCAHVSVMIMSPNVTRHRSGLNINSYGSEYKNWLVFFHLIMCVFIFSVFESFTNMHCRIYHHQHCNSDITIIDACRLRTNGVRSRYFFFQVAMKPSDSSVAPSLV